MAKIIKPVAGQYFEDVSQSLQQSQWSSVLNPAIAGVNQLAHPNIGISDRIASFSTTSTVNVLVTGASVKIRGRGIAISVFLQPAPLQTSSGLTVTNAGGATVGIYTLLKYSLSDTTAKTLGVFQIGAGVVASTTMPSSVIHMMDLNIGEDTYFYQLQLRVSGGTTPSASVTNVNLIAREG